MRLGTLVAAVLLPPLGVRLVGASGRAFWTTCGLTVLGVIPGALFALWTVARGS